MSTRKIYKDCDSRESRVAAQRIVENDIEEEHRAARIPFSPERICTYDVKPNVVSPEEITKYMRRFDLDSNPFITWFLAEARLAPAQLTPNSYRILMCMWHMWHRMKRPPPTPREIRHFYELRPVGKTGVYFLQSTQLECWIPKDVVVKGEIEPTTDKKMKGFVWGFPTSNKFWKNSWFFVGKSWGQPISFNLDGTQITCKVPRYFCSPQWNHMTSTFTDEELKTLARAAVRSLEKRGKPYLYNEGKMIKARIFPQISACRKRLLRQRDAGIAPPEDESDESTPENPPEGDDKEGVPNYVPEETHGQETTACSAEAVGVPESFGVSRTAADQDNPAVPSSKGKERMGHPSEPEQVTFPSGSDSPHPTANMPNATSQGAEAVGGHSGVVAPEILTPAKPISTPGPEIPTSTEPISTLGEGGVEMRHPDSDFEDPATDLNPRRRQEAGGRRQEAGGEEKSLVFSWSPNPQDPPSRGIS
ncbi:hypothetical protein LWI29_003244 [Acer saccharum]|uniref:Uncharacterized protein n=1 Tax=Acer saccharum TaxID=4024 RepID=A0AA39S758_ACESA|nr:hypothetical protein LWI29_003244 [Acer saccharum]